VRDERVRRLLQSAAAPGELDAERRAWAVVRAAYDPAAPTSRRAWPTRPLIALAAVLALVAAALSPPGRAVGGWMRDAIGRERVAGRADARPALASLPAPGRLLVVSARGAWVVNEDGSKRRLGAYGDASWSPRGLHVVLVRGPRLVAATPTGEIRWTLTRRPRVIAPRWSPSGFRIAYGARGALRVVNGDGEPDRLLAARAVPGAWAWHPDAARHVLAYATPDGIVRVVDVDAERVLWRTRRGSPVLRVEWSADGEELLVVSPRRLRTFARPGERRLNMWVPLTVRTAGFAPSGREIGFMVSDPTAGESAVFVYDGRSSREVFSGAGRFGDLEWSPDGRWLLVTWPSADQWLFLRMPRVGEIRAVSDIQREFDPGGGAAGAPPRPAGWCCRS
jgi:hypothetical protein